ncbi:hypothetical protein [Mycobacterium tuberculosis]|uniref:hypothetical protein n=1 Tax=Mycobacterium tuberculosis TaxID=1773 RepID=UPI000696890D|nr:hypothetical protein [Mycobacterium tuberculosis]
MAGSVSAAAGIGWVGLNVTETNRDQCYRVERTTVDALTHPEYRVHTRGVQRVRVTRNARKHRVSKHRIVAAMRHCGVPVLQEDGSLYYQGRDTSGRLTEVVAVEADDGDLIITHAMPKEWKR